MKKNITLYILLSLMMTGVAFASEGAIDQKFQGFNLQGYSDTGEKAWDVKGDTANVKGADIELSNVNANSYGPQKVNVTAETGKVDQVNGNMHLEKDVIVTREDGTQMMTNSLDWHRDKDLVTTPDDVVITNQQFTATGKGMQAHPEKKDAQLNKDVTVRVDTKPNEAEKTGDKNKFLTITSDGPMTIDQEKSMAVFETNVYAAQSDRSLKADRMEVYFNPGMNDIKEMVCIGNVVVVQGENKSYADKAVYKRGEQKIILSGRPKLIMDTAGGAFAAPGN